MINVRADQTTTFKSNAPEHIVHCRQRVSHTMMLVKSLCALCTAHRPLLATCESQTETAGDLSLGALRQVSRRVRCDVSRCSA